MRTMPLHARALAFLDGYGWIGPLLVRLVFGYFWLETGWAKLHNLAFFTERFIEWGIPWPALSATVCAATEFIGGVLIMLGLATRPAMLAMIFNMMVALAVVVLPGISTLDDFVELDEVLYVAVFAWLFFAGPGRASLDYLIGRNRDIRNARSLEAG